jgi:UDP-N-acetylmuramate dehydrogenase
LRDVRETVIALRRAKSMVLDANDENRRSVGSFFTNVLLSRDAADALYARAIAAGIVTRAEDVPRFEGGAGRVKIPAAWLIERAGLRKGERWGAFGLSSKHALSLVHHGGGTSTELIAAADHIRARVHAVFGVDLAMEPVRVA